MANHYGIYNQGTVVLEYWQGDIEFEELIEHELLQIKDKGIIGNGVLLADCSNAIFNIENDRIYKFTQLLKDQDKGRFSKLALIVNENTWQKANIYCLQAWQYNVKALTFYDLAAACHWLNFDEGNILSRLNHLKDMLNTQQEEVSY